MGGYQIVKSLKLIGFTFFFSSTDIKGRIVQAAHLSQSKFEKKYKWLDINF
jgi:hypothetical protein